MAEILYVHRWLKVISISYTSFIKYLVNPVLVQRARAPSTLIQIYFDRITILEENVGKPDIDIDDMGVGVDMREHTNAPDIATKEKRAPTTSTLSLTSTSNSIGESTLPYHYNYTFTTISIRFIVVPYEFL